MTNDISINFINLGIVIRNLGKSLNLFGFEIAYYGMIIALAMIVGIGVAVIFARKTGQDPNLYLDFAIYMVIFSIIGARLYYVIFEWKYYAANPLEILNLRGGGLAIYGGIIAAVITCYVFARIKKASFWKMVDTACLGLVVGQSIGRWGNFFNREAYGGFTDNLFAMQIKLEEAGGVVTQELRDKIVINNGVEYIQVHPTFLYESLWNIGVFILILLFRRFQKYDGEIFTWYVFGYALGRFWIEGLRTDQLIAPVINLPVSQLLSALLAVAAAVFWIYKRNKLKKRTA
ncbi:prolipoprotein diacylglyceryl transferase [Parasporobacterium paucivorans]|uniref:Phosphatidylglycerol--prolipoprotein diacylglyceryl transferase n=1 Tax=Parasporobacterium paucivorans DSM 15970 TaxID=1122934 RepID=A0A1M6G3D9_9FIRM|nr:prolipoprotein diacylglyceryl transferase [Parasporobacterium paucivorans]SHJ04471.1 phosphatidylglycerol:prolipoprotein diacylglycerol transferase [Parasporobacterium paucivorans DSM 15970]